MALPAACGTLARELLAVKLCFLTSMRQGQLVDVPPTGLTIGRAAVCDLALDDSSVSRCHCMIRQVAGQWEIEDHSTNGTFVNGELIPEIRELVSGDQIEFSEIVLLFLDDARAAAQASDEEAPEPSAEAETSSVAPAPPPAPIEEAPAEAARLAFEIRELGPAARKAPPAESAREEPVGRALRIKEMGPATRAPAPPAETAEPPPQATEAPAAEEGPAETTEPPPQTAEAPAAEEGPVGAAEPSLPVTEVPPAPVAAARGAPRVALAGAPALEFQIRIKAKLETKRVITDGAHTSLDALRQTGNLARNFTSTSTLDSIISSRRYFRFDRYRLMGEATCRLTAPLRLDGKPGSDESDTEVGAELHYSREFLVPFPDDRVTADSAPARLELRPPRQSVSLSGMGDETEATMVILKTAILAAARLLRGVRRAEVREFMVGLFQKAVLDGRAGDEADVDATLAQTFGRLCGLAAEHYRNWYGERWSRGTVYHDSQVHIGKLMYRYGAAGKQIGPPQGLDTEAVYRML